MPHLTWDISFGQIIISIPIFWLMMSVLRIYKMMLNFRIEHEIVMQDWASRQTPPVKLMELPTRQTKWW